MAAFATLQDLSDRLLRALTGAEADLAQVMLEDASFLLRMAVPGLEQAVEDDADIAYAAMYLTVTMVKRGLSAIAMQTAGSPAVDQVSQTFGPYSQSIKYRSDDGNLWLYNRELEGLLGMLRGDVAEAVSLRSPGF